MEQEPTGALINAEMAPLQVRSPFRLTHCMNEGQMTPPASPALPQARHGPKLQLSSFFRRSKSVRSKPTAFHDRTRTTTIRPSVVEMKAPFPLLLPESPSVTENSPSIPNLSPGLRRMSASYHDLRAFAQRQASTTPETPLLPSSISRGPEKQDKACLHFQNSYRRRDSLADTDSLESEEILTYYYDDRQPSNEQPCGYRRDSWTSDDTEIDDEEQSTASESMPVTPSGKEYCETIRSDESGWLANTTSHEERMRRFKTRFYQVVQHPWTSALGDGGEDEVMIATVLVGPGKPKLVQIQRPPSSQASQEAEIAQSACEYDNSGNLVHDHAIPMDSRPCTPIQRPTEVSAFSPYDTPGPEDTSVQHISIDSCISTTAYAGSRVQEYYENACPSSESLLPAPLSLPSRTRTSRSDSSVFSSTLKRLQDLTDPFGTSSTLSSDVSMRRRLRRSKRSHDSRHMSNTSHHSQSWPIDNFPQPTKQSHQKKSAVQVSPTLRPATLTRLRKLHSLNRVLSAVTQAIDHFPSNLLHLSSPAVLELRPSNVSEQTYIDALKRIFPSASSTLLGSLTAWILIDLFFEKVKNESKGGGAQLRPSCVSGSGSLFIKEKDPNHQTHYRRDSSYCLIRISTNSSSSSYCPGQQQYRKHHEHYEQSPQTHQRTIPSKAQEMLGIGTPDVTSIRLSELALRKRAESVGISVTVVGQRLVEAIRGSAGWDEDVWRALRVLVDVIGLSAAASGCGNGTTGTGIDDYGDRVSYRGRGPPGAGVDVGSEEIDEMLGIGCLRERWRGGQNRVLTNNGKESGNVAGHDNERERERESANERHGVSGRGGRESSNWV